MRFISRAALAAFSVRLRVFDAALVVASVLSSLLATGCGGKDKKPGAQVSCYEQVAVAPRMDPESLDLLDFKLGVLEKQVSEGDLDREATMRALKNLAAEVELRMKACEEGEDRELSDLSERADALMKKLEGEKTE